MQTMLRKEQKQGHTYTIQFQDSLYNHGNQYSMVLP